MVLPATATTTNCSKADRVLKQSRTRLEVEEALAFAALEAKRQFNGSH
jgi:hypothetical protein